MKLAHLAARAKGAPFPPAGVLGLGVPVALLDDVEVLARPQDLVGVAVQKSRYLVGLDGVPPLPVVVRVLQR